VRNRLLLGLGGYTRSLIRPLLPVRGCACRATRNSGEIVVKDLSSNRLRALLKKLRKLLLNKHVWYRLMLILKVLKYLEGTDEWNE
jgi:hypothetical protein